MNRARSKSAPRERGPRVVHKNSPTKSALKQPTQTPRQAEQFQRSTQVPKVSLQSLRPSTANSAGSAYSNRSITSEDLRPQTAGSARSNDSCAISEDHVGFNSHRERYTGNPGAEKCICHICTCGKHRCPVKHQYKPNSIPLDAVTSYAATFKEHSPDFYPTRQSPSSFYMPTKTTPGHFETTNATTFVAPDPKHAIAAQQERMERSAPRRRQSTDDDKFDHTSSQRADYPWHKSAPPERARPATARPAPGGAFLGVTTAMDHYQAWEPSKDAFDRSINRHTSRSPFPDSPIDFNTSYANNYIHHGVPEKARNAAPKPHYSYGSPRDFSTSNKLDFQGRQNPNCPAIGLPPRPASATTGHVRYHLDYTGTWN